jgi:hypothetical protein
VKVALSVDQSAVLRGGSRAAASAALMALRMVVAKVVRLVDLKGQLLALY